jgi:ribosomal protein S18 acetylase RimI-like enzyme
MERTRSEYRATIPGRSSTEAAAARHVADGDRDALAPVLLAAYRGTLDDEGESIEDAFDAIDDYLERIVREHSFVVVDDTGDIVAMSFVVVVEGRHYIDPVAVHPRAKRSGLGRAAVATALGSLVAAGVTEVGATITDGNTASERLFASLGFERVGNW